MAHGSQLVNSRSAASLVLFAVFFALPPGVTAADVVEVNNLHRSGKYADCVTAAAEGLAESPFSETFYVLKLQSEMQLGRYADALKTLDAGLTRLPASIQLRWLGRDVCRFNNEVERSLKLEAEIVEMARQYPWRYSDFVNQLVVGRLMLSQGVDPKKVLDGVYGEIKKRQPGNVEVLLASGELALQKHDYKLAGDAFQQAAKIDPTNAEAHFGIARAFAPSESEKAEAAIQSALEQNPSHVEALLLIVDNQVDSEQYDRAEETLARVAAVNPHHPRALAYKAVIAHLRNQPETEKLHRAAALRHWPTNPAVDHLIGKKLSQKYRFAEGEKYQRQALKADPGYLPAKEQLAQDLLRLGREEEGLKLAEEVYEADGYNVLAHNLVALQEGLSKFRTLEEDGLIVRMEAREAEIYGAHVLALLKRAKQSLCVKYEVELKTPVIVEIFPRQQDFAIRTFGMPGGAGFLGVCFGTVITANSPAALGTSSASWEATLWHEFCHVVTLNKTNNKMPRWLSEGISVYEERQADPAWGQAINPRYREMILGDDLTPVSQLSGAFLSPKSALHLQFAYFESSLVVEYLIEKHGLETLKRVLTDLGVGMSINESLARYAGSLESLDAEFATFARERANAMAPKADWSTPELSGNSGPRRASPEDISVWLADHPNNYPALRQLAQQAISAKKWDEARQTLEKMIELYQGDAGSDSAYALLAKVYRETGENSKERQVLEKLAELSADNVEVFARLGDLSAQSEDWQASRKYAQRWLGVNPLLAEPHRRAAEAAEKLEDHEPAVESYRALLLMEPFDPAQIHFQLATALRAGGKLPEAKRHVLIALEETPRFQAAQRLLLEMVKGTELDSDRGEDK